MLLLSTRNNDSLKGAFTSTSGRNSTKIHFSVLLSALLFNCAKLHTPCTYKFRKKGFARISFSSTSPFIIIIDLILDLGQV